MDCSRTYRLVCACLIPMLYSPANASLVSYTSEPEFLAAVPIVSTETFDGFSLNTIFTEEETIIDNVHYINPTCATQIGGTSSCWSIRNNIAAPNSAPNSLFWSTIDLSENSINFGLNNYVDAFGFWFLSAFGDAGDKGWIITVKEVNGQTQTISFTKTEQQTLRYFGFISDVGITEVLAQSDASFPSSTVWQYDNVSRSEINSPVPIPQTIFLFGSGLLGLIGISRRQLS